MILETLVSFAAVACFAVAFVMLNVASVAQGAMAKVSAGLSAMLDSELDDHAKEIAVRRSGVELILSAFDIFWRFLVILAAAVAPIFLSETVLPVARVDVFALLLTWKFILIVTIAAFAVSFALRRLRSKSDAESVSVNRYSSGDRMLHMLAFSSPSVPRMASTLEDRLMSRNVAEPSGPPIFVTSLARGGTTAILNALHSVPEIATHTYRDMPFLTAPLLWNFLGRRSKRQVARHQRAHGDGLEIDLNSPEAFEEVIWKMFWPDKFKGDDIATWRTEDRNAKADRFLAQHMKKIIQARSSKLEARPSRYCSKNNTNIARISYLIDTFPDCKIVIPVRKPECHAASLLRQHNNFLKLHVGDDFVRRYMRDIGHYEFGLLHKPIAFNGFDHSKHPSDTPDYWIYYWTCAFEHVLQQRELCTLVFQDELRKDPDKVMGALIETLHLTKVSDGFSPHFRSGADTSPTDVYDPTLLARAHEVYQALQEA